MTDQKLIADGGFSYKLFDRAGKLVLNVNCGTVAMFDIELLLTPAQRERFADEGTDFLDEFAHEVSHSPDSFIDQDVRKRGTTQE